MSGARRLPVQYTNGIDTVHDQAIVPANEHDVKQYANERQQTCATCAHFKHKAGQNAMAEQRFLERLVLEENWKVEHLGAGPRTMGLCGQSDGSTLVSWYSRACDQYAPRRGRIREDGDW